MQKWEYLEVHMHTLVGGKIEFSLNGVREKHDDFPGLFNRLGEQGWGNWLPSLVIIILTSNGLSSESWLFVQTADFLCKWSFLCKAGLTELMRSNYAEQSLPCSF